MVTQTERGGSDSPKHSDAIRTEVTNLSITFLVILVHIYITPLVLSE